MKELRQRGCPKKTCWDWPRAGSGVVRMDPLRFLVGCRTSRDVIKTRESETKTRQAETETKTREAETKTKTSRVETKTKTSKKWS